MRNESSSSWARLLTKLHLKPQANRENTLPPVGNDGLLSDAVEHPDDVEIEAQETEKGPGPLARWTKRDQTLVKLQEGYEQVTRLIEQIQKHLLEQSDRSERIAGSLEQLARSVGDMPEVSRQQAETLGIIAGRMDTANTRNQQLAETLGELPKIARTQGDTLAGIHRQLEMAGEQQVIASRTMDKLGNAVATVHSSSQSQTAALRQMDARTSEHNELLIRLIASQNRRFLLLLIVIVLLAAAAVGLGVWAVLLTRGGL